MQEKRINKNRMGRGRRSPGFTLVEIVVVICVIVAFSGVVTISFGKFDQDSRLNVAAGRVLADLRYAQEVAMTERREVNFYVTPSTTYYANYQAGGANVKSPLNPGMSMSVTLNVDEFKGIVISSSGVSGSRLSFNSDGVPLLNGNVLANQVSVMLLNGKQNIVLFPSGYSVINPVSGACGGCGC